MPNVQDDVEMSSDTEEAPHEEQGISAPSPPKKSCDEASASENQPESASQSGSESGPAPEDPASVGACGGVVSPEKPKRSSLISCEDESRRIYHVKWISWKGKRVPVVTQNENGPCPLLSVVNVMLLQGKMTLAEGCEVVSSEQLMQRVGDALLNSLPSNISSSERLNLEQNVSDAIAILPKLQTGLDVNVQFVRVTSFEFTPTLVIFDLLHIPLYHGWLVDPQEKLVEEAVGNLGYDQLVEKIITNKSSSENDLVNQSYMAQQFLTESASQLTYHGLCELNMHMKNNEMAVFFRNNHFSTIYKHNNELFLLVTDQGFLKEPRVVWETLSTIDGDDHFVDSDFITVTPKEEPKSNPVDSEAQIKQDHLLAMTLEAEEKKFTEESKKFEDFKAHQNAAQLTDEELAKRLQDEENRAASGSSASSSRPSSGRQAARPEPVPHGAAGGASQPQNQQRNRNGKNCTIL